MFLVKKKSVFNRKEDIFKKLTIWLLPSNSKILFQVQTTHSHLSDEKWKAKQYNILAINK